MPLTLTRLGERVLENDADRVTLLGVDRWVGGTHVTTAAAWRWDPAAQRLVNAGLTLPGYDMSASKGASAAGTSPTNSGGASV